MGILADAPKGFSEAVAAINSLPQGLLVEMSQDVIAFLRYQTGFIHTDHYELMMEGLTISPKPDIKVCVNALSYVFRAAAQAKLSSDALMAELKSSMEWNESAMTTLRHVWKEEGSTLTSVPMLSLSIGQLVSVDWKLGIAMSSSGCKSVNSPYVTLQLRVAESEHVIKQHTLNMTVAQFQNFSAQLKEMANTLETAA